MASCLFANKNNPVRGRRQGFCLAVTGLFCLMVGTSLAAKAPPGPRASIVKVAVVAEQMIAPTTWVAGTVISRNDARLAAEIVGRLTAVAEVGKHFQKGEVIVRIDDITLKLALAEAKAGVVREQARVRFQKNEVDRLEKLAMQNSAAKTQLDLAQSDRDVAVSELDVARLRAEFAKEQLSRTMIRAPFNGVVTERLARTGERVDQGNVVVRFVDADSYEVQARVSYASISHINPGSILKIKSNATLQSGVVRTRVPVGDDLSRLYDVRLDVTGSNWSVGQTVKVAVPTAEPKNAIVVPRDALILRRNGIAVYKVNDENKVERIAVKTGVANGAVIEIIGALQAGQRVVTRGGERLRPGQTVKILPGGD